MMLNVFYALGVYFLELNWSGSFLLLALAFSNVIAKESDDGDTYFNDHNLEDYSSDYYFAYNRLLLSIIYIFLGYKDYFLMTLDITAFVIAFGGNILYWHTVFFIPESGELSGWRFALLQLTTLLCFVFSLLLIIWLVTNFEGITWFSPIITTPFFAIYDVIGGIF